MNFENDVVDTASGETVTITSGTVPIDLTGMDSFPAWTSQALYYFLTRSVNSSKIIETMSSTLITNMDASGIPIVATITIPPVSTDVDMLRFVDPWGKSLRYTYISGNSFPVIKSAGIDGQFDTSDDISSQ